MRRAQRAGPHVFEELLVGHPHERAPVPAKSAKSANTTAETDFFHFWPDFSKNINLQVHVLHIIRRGGPGGPPPGGGLGAEPPVYGGELFRKKCKILKDRAFFRHFFRHRFRQKTTPWTENGPQYQCLDHGGGSAVCALSTPKK